MDEDIETNSYEDDYDYSEESHENSNNHLNMDRLPLVPTDFSSITEALQNFAAVFESRYGGMHPRFQVCSLQSALDEAFGIDGNASVMEQRPLAIYLHRDDGIGSNIFAQNVLCSEAVSSLLSGQFILWPWDMSQMDNRAKLYEWLIENGLTQAKDVAKAASKDDYPLLILLVKERSTVNVEGVIKGTEPAEGVMEKLITCLDSFQSIKNRAMAEEQQRLERAAVRQEQVEEYEKAKAIDRARQEERIEAQKRDEEIRKQEEEEAAELERRRQEIRDSLPGEPTTGETVRAAIRFPNGIRVERRFDVDSSLELLFNVAFANENCPVDFTLVSNYPRQEIACAPQWYRRYSSSADIFTDNVPTFREAGFTRPFAVMVSDNKA